MRVFFVAFIAMVLTTSFAIAQRSMTGDYAPGSAAFTQCRITAFRAYNVNDATQPQCPASKAENDACMAARYHSASMGRQRCEERFNQAIMVIRRNNGLPTGTWSVEGNRVAFASDEMFLTGPAATQCRQRSMPAEEACMEACPRQGGADPRACQRACEAAGRERTTTCAFDFMSIYAPRLTPQNTDSAIFERNLDRRDRERRDAWARSVPTPPVQVVTPNIPQRGNSVPPRAGQATRSTGPDASRCLSIVPGASAPFRAAFVRNSCSVTIHFAYCYQQGEVSGDVRGTYRCPDLGGGIVRPGGTSGVPGGVTICDVPNAPCRQLPARLFWVACGTGLPGSPRWTGSTLAWDGCPPPE